MSVFTAVLVGALLVAVVVYALPAVVGRRARTGLLAASLHVLDAALVYGPTLLGLGGMTWAWSGKLAEVVVFSVVAARLPELRPALRLPPPAALAAAVAVALLLLAPSLLTGTVAWSWRPHFVAYQATMPGIAEELVFRGVLLAVLDRAFGRSVRAFGVHWGPGAVLTTLAFWLGHAITVDPTLSIDLSIAADMTLFGLAMCWLRYRFDSVWAPAVAHNAHNVALVTLGL